MELNEPLPNPKTCKTKEKQKPYTLICAPLLSAFKESANQYYI